MIKRTNNLQRPNFLFIMCDQLRADHLGCYGNSVIRTPYIDSLAARGARFDRSYVAYPVCMPNRACLMTGQMASDHRGINNGIPLDLESTTFVDVLAHHGYQTGLIGKSHLQGYTPRDPMYGYIADDELAAPPEELQDALRLSRWSKGYRVERRIASGELAQEPYQEGFYGFQHAELVTRHADFTDGHHLAWAEKQRPDFKSLVGVENALPDQRPRGPQAWRTAVPPELYSTQFIADRSKAYIAESAKGDKPFFLQVSFTDPHHPFTPPGKYWDMYDPDDILLPNSFGQITTPRLQQVHKMHAEGKHKRKGGFAMPVNEEELRALLALTYGMISFIDDAIGKLLSQLKEDGLLENTVIVFMSDHGDLGGDHGVMLKRMHHYQGLIRVPTLWVEPGAAASVRDDLTSTIDFPTTILRRAGIQPFNGAMGRDLFSDQEPDGLIIEEAAGQPKPGTSTPPSLRTLVTRSHRMTLSPDDNFGELYDLARDPDENANIFDDPSAAKIRTDLMEIMVRRMMQLQTTSPLPPFAP